MGFENLSGQVLGQYELREMLGQGGMGAVYRAVQSTLNRDVAVKVLPSSLAQQIGYLERFNREAQIAAALQHPHIVPIIDYGTQRGISYVVMRLLTGGNLAQRIIQRQNEDGAMPSPGEAARMLSQIADALDYAHSQGVIHRDIKTSNIMFDDQGNAYVVDFGIAKLQGANQNLTSTGMTLGTSAYMPPEQWRSEPLTAAADQYALGIVMYTLLTGRIPYQSDTPGGLMYKHFNEMPTPSRQFRVDLPEKIDEVINRALAKKAEDRFADTRQFAQAFQQAISGHEGVPNGFYTFKVHGTPRPLPLTPINPATGSATEVINKPVEPTPSEPIATEVQPTSSPIPPVKSHVPKVVTQLPPYLWGLALVAIIGVLGIGFLVINNRQQPEIALLATPTPTLTVTPSPTIPASPTSTPITPTIPVPTNTSTPTATITVTATPSPTSTFTSTSTSTATATATATATVTASATATTTYTATATATASFTATATASLTPTATNSPTITLTPSTTVTPTMTNLPTNDLVFDVSTPTLWKQQSIQSLGNNTWEIGLDPILVYSQPLSVCLRDYNSVSVTLSVSLPQNAGQQTAQIYYKLDGQTTFDETHVARLPLDSGAELQTLVYPIRSLAANPDSHLTEIRLDPADGTNMIKGTVRVIDFRLTRGNNSVSNCLPITAAPTRTPEPSSTPTALPSNYQYSNELNGQNAGELSLSGFEMRDIQGKRAYCGTASSEGNRSSFSTYQPFQQDFAVESSVYLSKVGSGYWWVELRVRSSNNWQTGYVLSLEANGAYLRRADGVLLQKSNFNVTENGWYTLMLVVKRNQLTAFVNEIAVGDAVVDNTYRAGMAAIGGGNVDMCIDRIVMRKPVALPPATPVGLVLPGRIAFTSKRFGNPEIMLVNPAELTSLERITRNDAIDSHPSISPNGNLIAFDTNRQGNFDIFTALTNGLLTYSITSAINAESNPTWSPNGNQIAYNITVNGTTQINRIDLNSDTITPVSQHNQYNDSNPSWSPTNKTIVFQSVHGINREIYSIGVNGLAYAPLTSNAAVDTDPDWSPDGQQIVFSSNRDGNYEIYVMNADGSSLRRLTTDSSTDEQPTWSPDGQYIAFVSDRSGNKDIWVMNASDGSIVANLTADSDSADYDPDWGSPQNTVIFSGVVTVIVKTSTANLRRGPDTSYAVIGVAIKGTSFTAIGRSENRQWILIEDDKGKKGWINSDLVSVSGALIPLPIGSTLPS